MRRGTVSSNRCMEKRPPSLLSCLQEDCPTNLSLLCTSVGWGSEKEGGSTSLSMPDARKHILLPALLSSPRYRIPVPSLVLRSPRGSAVMEGNKKWPRCKPGERRSKKGTTFGWDSFFVVGFSRSRFAGTSLSSHFRFSQA